MTQPRRKKPATTRQRRGTARQGSSTALESKEFRETVALLARAVGSQGPRAPRRLRKRLLDSIAAVRNSTEKGQPDLGVQVWRQWEAPQARRSPGLVVRRARDGGWQEINVPGVSVRPLNVDAERRYVTMLVRMEPGASYPEHSHAGVEECYVLQGDLRVGDDTLHAGDYQCADGGSEHGAQSTEKGCLLLIVSSQDDKLL